MKTCECCGTSAEQDAATCGACGEASWMASDVSAPAEPVMSKRAAKRAAKSDASDPQ